MSKVNFIVSSIRDFWIDNNQDKYFLDPFDYHLFEESGEHERFSIQKGKFVRTCINDLEEDDKYVNVKYNNYIKILSYRLNKIHKTDYSEKFWKKALSLPFLRYITIIYDLYKSYETNFDINKYACVILSSESYHIPIDFEEQRDLIQNSHYGKEQVFSLYVQYKYRSTLRTIKLANPFAKERPTKTRNKNKWIELKKILKTFLKSSRAILKKSNHSEVIRNEEVKSNFKLGIFGTYFSPENLAYLVTNSEKKIISFPYPRLSLDQSLNISNRKRKRLSKFESNFDDFDKFFFTTIKYLFPKIFLEDFKSALGQISSIFEPFKSLKYLVSEVWISNSHASLALAVEQNRGVIHINNEHNAISHPFKGTFTNFIIDNSDIFYSLGWKGNQANVVKGASLYDFNLDSQEEKIFDILYISGPFQSRMPNLCSLYSLCEEYVPHQLNFLRVFFQGLTASVMSHLTYKGYPKSYGMKLMNYNKEYSLNPWISKCNDITETSEKARLLMPKARLVILDYISTSLIEALYSNVPTIFFWPNESYQLQDQYMSFFDDLLKVGICQRDPVAASKFVYKIYLNPEEWWYRSEVQEAKNAFMKKNLGDKEEALGYYLSLVK